MMTAIPTRVFALLIALIWATNLFAAYEELGVEENNEFGGRSLIFRKLTDGVQWGKNSYDSAGKLMHEERKYSDEWANAHGTRRLVNEYLFDIKVKEERTFSQSYAIRRQVIQRNTFYEQATGTKIREENKFAQAYLGNNVIYYDLGVKKWMEWFYPANQEGYKKVVTHYGAQGKIRKIENYYTDKSVKFDGCLKHVIYFFGLKKSKEEWHFTEKYTQENNGAVRKMKVYFDNPNHPKAPQIYYFDQNNELVVPNQPFDP